MAEVKTPRPGRSASSSRGVTVATSQKSKPKNAPFKFLRKDEGRLSYTCQPDSPMSGAQNHNTSQTGGPPSERPASRSLREAIASDMRKGKNHDPFAGVVVAVPKRAPPPNPTARDEAEVTPDPSLLYEPKEVEQQQQPQQQQQQQQQQPQVVRQPNRGSDNGEKELNGNSVVAPKPRQPIHSSEEPDRSLDYIGLRINTGRSHTGLRRTDDYDDVEWQQQPPSVWRGNDRAASNGVFRRTFHSRYMDPMGQDDYAQSGQNFFRRSQRQEYRHLREEDTLVEQLEEELFAAKEERGRYHQLKMQLDRDRQRFDDYRSVVEREIEEERAELDAARALEQRRAKKDIKLIEERYKSTLDLLKSEREANKKLTQENELLQQQLEGITTRMRETQKLQKAEAARLRREIESLTRRNEELLEMTREQQISALVSTTRLPLSLPAPQLALANRPPTASSDASGWRDSDGSYDHTEDRLQLTKAMAQQRRDFAGSIERKSLASEEMERKRLASEEMERKRLASEEMERKRLASEEMERKRLASEEMEKKRLEAEEMEIKRLEAEEIRRKRLEAEEIRRKRLEAEEMEKKSVEAGEMKLKSLNDQEGKNGGSQELRSQRWSAGHPINTPRAQNVKPRVVQQQRRASLTSSTVPVLRRSRRAPTAEELIADNEPAPAEDFPNDSVVSQTALGENPNKHELLYRSGKREIHYANGTRKVILPSGHVVLYFTNGDVKRTFPSGKSTYWYAAAQTTHMQHADGVQVFQFHSSGQIERHMPDGKKEILYPDGIYKVIYADGQDETILPEER